MAVTFTSSGVLAAEVDHGSKKTLNALGEIEFPVNLAKDYATLDILNPKLIGAGETLRRSLKAIGMSGNNISFVLPADVLFLVVVPFDSTLSKQEVREQLLWEASHYHTEEQLAQLQLLRIPLGRRDDGVANSFLLGIRKDILSFLKSVAQQGGFKQKGIDVDAFAIERVVNMQYPETTTHSVVTVGLFPHGSTASTIVKGITNDVRCFPAGTHADMQKNLQEYFVVARELSGNAEPVAVLLWGEEAGVEMKELLRAATGKQTVLLNAVRKGRISKRIMKEQEKNTHLYAPAIGLALKDL